MRPPPGTDAFLDRLRTDEAVVPGIWTLGVANVLVVGQRRGRLTAAQSAHFVELLDQLPITVDPQASKLGELAQDSTSSGLGAYDAAYLVLATRLGLIACDASQTSAQVTSLPHRGISA